MATQKIETAHIISIILMTLGTVYAEECKNIIHTTAIHEDTTTNAYMKCDIDIHHEIRIFKAEYRVMKKTLYRPSDNEDLNESCVIRGLTDEIREKCHRNNECVFVQEDFAEYDRLSASRFPYKCDSYIGPRYLMIEWQCKAKLNRDYNAYAIDLADNRTHDVTFAVIDSHDLWRWTLNYCHPFLNHDCRITEESIRNSVLIRNSNQGCSCKIPAHTEVWVQTHEFYKFTPENQPDYEIGKCSQRIEVYNSEQRWDLCNQTDTFSLPCQETEHTLYLSFANDDTNIRVGFAIYFEVDYLASPMMMCSCGIPVSELPAQPNVDSSSVTLRTTTTTLGPLRTTVPTTLATAPAKQKEPFDFFKDMPTWVLILLAVLLSVIIMLIVISIVCLRHCCVGAGGKDGTDDLAQSESDWGSEVSAVYVEGGKSSKLVVNSLKASARSNGEIPFTY